MFTLVSCLFSLCIVLNAFLGSAKIWLDDRYSFKVHKCLLGIEIYISFRPIKVSNRMLSSVTNFLFKLLKRALDLKKKIYKQKLATLIVPNGLPNSLCLDPRKCFVQFSLLNSFEQFSINVLLSCTFHWNQMPGRQHFFEYKVLQIKNCNFILHLWISWGTFWIH